MDLETYAYNHILGGLYGQALGDAWAMPAYLRPYQTWNYYNGWIDQFLPAPPDHPVHAGLKAGQVTDDTQQAIVLAQTIIADGYITVESMAKAIVAWYDAIDGDNVPYIGPSTRRAVLALKAGQEPHTTGVYGDTNGGAMRISPIGLIHPGQPEAAALDAIIACTPTHFTDVALSGSCAVAAAVAQAMIPNTTLEDIIDMAIWAANMGLQYGSAWFGPSVGRKIDFAVQLATDTTLPERDRIQNLYDMIGSTLATADSVPCAFGILALAEGDPINSAIYAAALSGDADTIAAMACAIAGTWRGVEAIPFEHIKTLRQANPNYDFEDIADGLYEVALKNRDALPPDDDSNVDILGQDKQ